MANAPTGGTPGPDNEDDDELQHERQNEEEPRRPLTQHGGFPALAPGIDGTQLPQLGWSQPRPASPPDKSETLPSNWQDLLTQQLSKLNETQRAQYDRQIYGAKERNAEFVSPHYQLELSAFLAKDHKRYFGYDLHNINGREDQRATKELNKAIEPGQHPPAQARTPSKDRAKSDAAPPASERQPDTPRPTTPRETPRPAINPDSQRQNTTPAPRKAAPDRTGLARKRRQRQLADNAARRKELNLPPSRAEQNEMAQLDIRQEAERKALRHLYTEALHLLRYQHVAEQLAVATKWLGHDLKQIGSPEAASIKRQELDALRVADLAYRKRETLILNQPNHRSWDSAASASTYARPSETKEGQTNQRPAASPPEASKPTIAPPDGQDPNVAFKDRSGQILTEDRLRGMLHRYQELREIRAIPSGLDEQKEYARLTTAQNTVRTKILTQQNNATQLLAHEHHNERAGTTTQWLARDTRSLRLRDEARRFFTVARLSMNRRHAIDPRTRAPDDRAHAASNEQSQRHSAAQEAARSGRPLSPEERNILQASGKTVPRDRDRKGAEWSTGPQQDGTARPSSSRGDSRGGGGRGR